MKDMKCFINIENEDVINEIKRISGLDFGIVGNYVPCDRVEDIFQDLICEIVSLEERIDDMTTPKEYDPYDTYIDEKLESGQL